jgi:hypothetical protein
MIGGGNVFGTPETALPLTGNLVARSGFQGPSGRTTPKGNTLVRTKANPRWYAEHEGYTITAAVMNWKAARSIAAAHAKAASS